MDISIEELQNNGEVRISVIGVGGGGGNAINHLSTHGVHSSIKLIAANTDMQHLNGISSHIRLQLGENTTKGLGAGMRPEIGRKSAEESYENIKEALQGSQIVFVTTGLGGGTGTGASPIVARAAKEIGALTIAVATKPFKFEGQNREHLAEEGLKDLKSESDAIVVIPNDKLLTTISKNLGMRDSLKLVDDVLARAVNGISSFILNPNPNAIGQINVDHSDLKTTMEFKGLALIGMGEKDGDDAATEAIRDALESPLLDNVNIKGAMGAIVNFEIHPDYSMLAISDAVGIIQSLMDPKCEIKWGTTYNNDFSETFVRVTLVATGFEKEIIQKADSPQEKPADNAAKITSPSVRLKRVSNSDELLFDDQDLETPTFLRYQRD